jgi:hypothetical protein
MGAAAFRRFDNALCRLVEDAVIIGLETDTDLLL